MTLVLVFGLWTLFLFCGVSGAATSDELVDRMTLMNVNENDMESSYNDDNEEMNVGGNENGKETQHSGTNEREG